MARLRLKGDVPWQAKQIGCLGPFCRRFFDGKPRNTSQILLSVERGEVHEPEYPYERNSVLFRSYADPIGGQSRQRFRYGVLTVEKIVLWCQFLARNRQLVGMEVELHRPSSPRAGVGTKRAPAPEPYLEREVFLPLG